MAICPSCGEENPDRLRLCGFCGTPLAPVAPPQEVRKTVTIVFSDLKGSTSLGEALDSESLREVMTRYFDEMRRILESHGGTIEKFIGDAVMAVFGLPKLHEGDALRAVRAAHEMQQALAALNVELEQVWGVRLENRTGVNTREVVAGDPTAGQRLVVGDAVNVAARLEQAAGATEVLLGDLTYNLVRDAVEADPVEPLTLKGKSEPVPAYRLLAVRASGDGYARHADAPLVGRSRDAAGIAQEDPPDVARTKLAGLVAPPDEAVVARVAAAIGLSSEQFPIEELFWGIRKLLESLARERGAVVLFDDVHWAEPTFLDLVEHLVESVQDAPLLLLCPSRPDLLERRPEWAEGPSARRLPLAPLSETETERIVENLVGQVEIAPEVRRRIVEASEGNPLFAEQLLSMLVDGGYLRLEDGRWRSDGALSELEMPPTIQALLAARLDHLAPEERAVVEPGSVIGLAFPQAAVEELVWEALRGRVAELLGTLSRKQFVRPQPGDELAYRFGHLLIRDATYQGLLKRTRAKLHEQFVDWADRVNRERNRAAEYEEILGYHLEQAYRYLAELGPLDDHGRELGRRAAERLASAGRSAFGRGDMTAAAGLLDRAAALLPP